VVIVTAGLSTYLFNLNISIFHVSLYVVAANLLVLVIGRYTLLDKLMKVLMVVLTIATVTAFVMALVHGPVHNGNTVSPDVWNTVGIGFLLALMGWMPAPIEISSFTSLWTKEKAIQTNHEPTLKEALVDFHIGYIGAAVMALFFVGLGALTMFGTGEALSSSAVGFSKQLVAMYTNALGKWSHLTIASIAFVTMFSTTLTVIDGYPRILEGSMHQLFSNFNKKGHFLYWIWVVFLAISSVVIIGYLAENMRFLINIATTLAFLAAPVFAFINFKVVTTKDFPLEGQPKQWLRILSWMGIIFLIGFSVLFIVIKL